MNQEKFMGVSEARKLNSKDLSDLPDEPTIVMSSNQPMAVMIRYDVYLKWQELAMSFTAANTSLVFDYEEKL